MTVSEKELTLHRCEILHKLGFERYGDLCELNFRRTIYFIEIGVVLVTVSFNDMKLYIHDGLDWKGKLFEKIHDIPETVIDNERDFSEWIVEIIKEDTENANPAN